MRRFYSNIAPPVTLEAPITDAAEDTSLSVASTTGYPAVPFLGGIDRGGPEEEVVLVTAVTPTSFTVVRGYDGTTRKAHALNAPFEHCSAAIEFDEANFHINDITHDHHPQYLNNTRHSAITHTGDMFGNASIPVAKLESGVVIRLNEVVLNSDAASVTFANIPQTYRSLMVVVEGRTSWPDPVVALLQFNGDTTNAYDTVLTHFVASNTAPIYSYFYPNQPGCFGPALAGAGSGSVVAGSGYSIIPHYRLTSRRKIVTTVGGFHHPSSTGGYVGVHYVGARRQNHAITQIRVVPAHGSFKSASMVSLYGLP